MLERKCNKNVFGLNRSLSYSLACIEFLWEHTAKLLLQIYSYHLEKQNRGHRLPYCFLTINYKYNMKLRPHLSVEISIIVKQRIWSNNAKFLSFMSKVI